MTKFITTIAVAAGILIAPNVAQAAGTFSNVKAINDAGQVIQVKQSRRHNRRHHNRHAGGRFFFDHNFHGDYPYRSCSRLKRKAFYTGSNYWWKKYRRCMSNRYY